MRWQPTHRSCAIFCVNWIFPIGPGSWHFAQATPRATWRAMGTVTVPFVFVLRTTVAGGVALATSAEKVITVSARCIGLPGYRRRREGWSGRLRRGAVLD